jgi:UDP-N-acetylmuramoylalanine-D-glutamate ligase
MHSWVVLELSSVQLSLCDDILDAHGALVTGLTIKHLQSHSGQNQQYLESKNRIWYINPHMRRALIHINGSLAEHMWNHKPKKNSKTWWAYGMDWFHGTVKIVENDQNIFESDFCHQKRLIQKKNKIKFLYKKKMNRYNLFNHDKDFSHNLTFQNIKFKKIINHKEHFKKNEHHEVNNNYVPALFRGSQDIWDLTFPNLASQHYRVNALGAYGLSSLTGLTEENFFKTLKTFCVSPHRQEIIGMTDSIVWVNDSKATDFYAAQIALERYVDSFQVIWIIGGKPEDTFNFIGYKPWLRQLGGIIVYGEAGKKYMPFFKKIFEDFCIPIKEISCFYDAVVCAYEQAQVLKCIKSSSLPPLILLSPACPSFDQFKNYEERGKIFQEIFYKYQKQNI